MGGVQWDLDLSILHDKQTTEAATGKRLTRRITFYLDPDTYHMLMNDVIHNPALNYSGDVEGFMREVVRSYLRSMQNYLSRDSRAVLQKIHQMQQFLTAEQYVLGMRVQLDQAVEHLAEWAKEKEWSAVVLHMLTQARWVDDMEDWGPRIARMWLQHPGVSQLRSQWAKAMPEDQYRRVEEVFKHWEGMV